MGKGSLCFVFILFFSLFVSPYLEAVKTYRYFYQIKNPNGRVIYHGDGIYYNLHWDPVFRIYEFDGINSRHNTRQRFYFNTGLLFFEKRGSLNTFGSEFNRADAIRCESPFTLEVYNEAHESGVYHRFIAKLYAKNSKCQLSNSKKPPKTTGEITLIIVFNPIGGGDEKQQERLLKEVRSWFKKQIK